MTDTGPPYPPPPGPTGIGQALAPGISQVGTPVPFDVWQTIISQYANSPVLTQLIVNMQDYIDQTENLDLFFDDMFNILTAFGYGLDVWGRIVGVTRNLTIVTTTGSFFGFEEAGTVDINPFNQAPFFSELTTLTSTFQLADDTFRTLILAKALANITDGSIPSINQILVNLFPGRGNCFVVDNENMTMDYEFEFPLTAAELAIVTQSGVLPKPAGVEASVIVEGSGFNPGGGGTPPSPSNPEIEGIILSNNDFVGGDGAGTTVGNIEVIMQTGSFVGTLSLSGANAADFQITGTALQLATTLAAGSYTIDIVATQAGAANSPFTQAETITGTSAGLLTNMVIANTSGTTQAAGFVTPDFGVTFAQGDVPAALVTTGNVTNGSNQITNLASTANVAVGQLIVAAGVPSCTTVVSIGSGVVTMSGTANGGGGNGITVVFSGAPLFTVGGTGGTVQPFSWGMQSYWSDWSLKRATYRLLCTSSIAGNSSITIDISNGGVCPTASSFTLAQVYAQDIQVNGSGIGGFGGLTGLWSAVLANNANNLAQALYMDGQAGRTWRVITNFVDGTAVHGQLMCHHYISALPNGSGALGFFRYLARPTQPNYDLDTPTKNWRQFASLNWQQGSGPTITPFTWPFNSINFTTVNGSLTLTCAGTSVHNYYSGASDGINVVPGYISSTSDANLTANGQVYFAYTLSAGNDTEVHLGTRPDGSGAFVTCAGGSGVFVPLPTCLHFMSVFGANSNAEPNFFQGTGSVSADNTVLVQFNQAYLHSTGVIPPWSLAVNGVAFGGTIEDATFPYQWNPVSVGNMEPADRGTTGSTAEIGPLQVVHSQHFYNQSATSGLVVRAIAFASEFDATGSFRDVTTGNYLNFSNNTYFGMPTLTSAQRSNIECVAASCSGFTAPANPSDGNPSFLWGGEQTFSHKPSMAFWAALVFGDAHFHDLAVEEANSALLEQFGPNRFPTDPVGAGIVTVSGENGLRSVAWSLRALLTNANVTIAQNHPDGSASCQYLRDQAVANTAWMNQIFNASLLGSFLNSENSWRDIWGLSGGLIDPSCGGFMMGYFLCVMAWAAGTGDANALAWLNLYQKWLNYIITQFGNGYYYYPEYDHAIEIDDTGAPTIPITSQSGYGIPASSVLSTVSWTTSGSTNFTIGSPTHGYTPANGDKIIWDVGMTIPGGFSSETPYYFRDVNGNDMNLAASPGGAVIVPTTSGSVSAGSGPAGGFSGPWMTLANPPPPSSGFIPNSSPTSVTDSYLLYRFAGYSWAEAVGASGFSAPLSDASTRLNTSPPNFAPNANWFMQNTL